MSSEVFLNLKIFLSPLRNREGFRKRLLFKNENLINFKRAVWVGKKAVAKTKRLDTSCPWGTAPVGLSVWEVLVGDTTRLASDTWNSFSQRPSGSKVGPKHRASVSL